MFNKANEIIERDLFSDTSTLVEPAYDRVGNMVDDGEGRIFVYDVFGRLVRITDDASPPNTVAHYTYNGLGYLIAAQYDSDDDGDVDDEVTERYVYDTRWRIVAVAVTDVSGTTTAIKEQYVHHNAGYDGYGNASLMDSIVLRDRDTGGSSDLEERIYYCQNHRGDVSALVDSAGYVMERVGYTPYGVPRVYPGVDGDWNADGIIDQDDLDDFAALWLFDNPLADVDGNGVIEPEDLAYYYASWSNGWTASSGLSVVTSNRFGYAGYLWSQRVEAYHVRHRVYDPAMGRWLSRDPIEYASGSQSLYEYVLGNPQRYTDSWGLAPDTNYDPELGWPSKRSKPSKPAAPGPSLMERTVRFIGPENVLACTGGKNHVPGIDAGPTRDAIVLGCDIVSIAAPCGAAAKAIKGGKKALEASKSPKIIKDMKDRGWTDRQIREAIDKGKQIPAINKANNNPATRYVHPKTGKSVVVDNRDNKIIHTGGPGFKYGPGSGDLP
jgi:RHS repeat-associated protein